jgi:hypothetical protein
MEPVICLLPSPFLGPAVWRPVARLLGADGWAVAETPPFHHAPRTSADALTALLTAIPTERAVLLVPHSNAGLYVPEITRRRNVAGYVFADAVLPGRSGNVPTVPPELYTVLAEKADDNGMLPPWTRWWDEDISGLFPDAAVRAEVECEERPVPLSYFGEFVEVPADWDERPGAYLAFGDTYEPERAAAAERGWPVRTMRGEHLHMLMDPAAVAPTIADLLRELADRQENS